MCLLFLQAHLKTDRFFTDSGVQFPEHNCTGVYRSRSLTTFLESSSDLFCLPLTVHDVTEFSNGLNKRKNGVSDSSDYSLTLLGLLVVRVFWEESF